MSLPERFLRYVRDNGLFRPKDHLLIAVSGGADSACLCELCHRAGFSFTMVHCNFQLRGAESDRDEMFVRSRAEHYRVPVHLRRFDTAAYAEQRRVSLQVAARELRYAWFEELVQRERESLRSANPDSTVWLLTAHHADDNIETVLINFFKGTGIRGLRGMLAKHHHLVRPLLFARRSEIDAFLSGNGIPFMEDSSNLTDNYTRNYFRHQVIPGIQKVFPGAEGNLLDNIERFADIETLYRQALERHRKKLLVFHEKEVHVPVLALSKTRPLATVVYEIVREYGFTPSQTGEVIHLLHAETGKQVVSPTHLIFRNRKWLIISPREPTHSANIMIMENEPVVRFGGGRLEISRYDYDPASGEGGRDIAVLDSAHIVYPLLLRKWKRGDYFYPLGMNKKKKLSRFFIDNKLSLAEKERTWLLESDKRIIWILNHRIDDRFKITPSTRQVTRFKMHGPS